MIGYAGISGVKVPRRRRTTAEIMLFLMVWALSIVGVLTAKTPGPALHARRAGSWELDTRCPEWSTQLGAIEPVACDGGAVKLSTAGWDSREFLLLRLLSEETVAAAATASPYEVVDGEPLKLLGLPRDKNKQSTLETTRAALGELPPTSWVCFTHSDGMWAPVVCDTATSSTAVRAIDTAGLVWIQAGTPATLRKARDAAQTWIKFTEYDAIVNSFPPAHRNELVAGLAALATPAVPRSESGPAGGAPQGVMSPMESRLVAYLKLPDEDKAVQLPRGVDDATGDGGLKAAAAILFDHPRGRRVLSGTDEYVELVCTTLLDTRGEARRNAFAAAVYGNKELLRSIKDVVEDRAAASTSCPITPTGFSTNMRWCQSVFEQVGPNDKKKFLESAVRWLPTPTTRNNLRLFLAQLHNRGGTARKAFWLKSKFVNALVQHYFPLGEPFRGMLVELAQLLSH